jgi:uncharacterized protein YacL
MDISNPTDSEDLVFIGTAAVIVELITLFLVKYAGSNPTVGTMALNDWYERFGIFAVAADVLSLIIGVIAARFLYTYFFKSVMDWSPLYFILCVVLFQLFHDLFFYFTTIQTLPRGFNEMIDVFQDYAKENGAKILVADAAMVTATAGGAMYLKSVPLHFIFAGLLVAVYAVCFIMFTAPTPTVAQKYQEKAPAPKVQQQPQQQQQKPSFQQDRQQGLLDPGSFDPRQLHTPFDPQGAY